MQDLGATFGGAGKRTKGSTAKMNLDEWTDKQVFKSSGYRRGMPRRFHRVDGCG